MYCISLEREHFARKSKRYELRKDKKVFFESELFEIVVLLDSWQF